MLRHVAAETLEGYAEPGWAGSAWHTREFGAGLLSHGFIAQRVSTD